ncbi:MAG TPA: GNAT family N-acetyltransferase [Ktedonobacteraceae bacterium]|nr:GNAT family N-acetyltransferase [Ktedonobacteraceae bacterium]
MQIVDLQAENESAILQVAAMVVEGFAANWPESWPDLASALEEVSESFQKGRISRIALDEDGTILGWIGGIRQYQGHVWELHPLVVHVSHQGQGIGHALVADLEERVRACGGLTITLGTDDVTGQTSLSGVHLYPQIWAHVANIRNLSQHPYEFYQKQGYVIVGVIPDANGLGKPDILMAKSLVR